MLLPILLFGSIGAITWAIRGTSGWGGVDGTIIPGITFGIVWYYLSLRKNIESSYLVFWLGLGIALGGELGYGQYVGWIRNIFSYGNEKLFIDSATGYIWFIICGIGWAAPGGIILGWAIESNISIKNWIERIILTLILLVVLFSSSTIDWLSEFFIKNGFTFIFPNFELGIYKNIDKNLERTLYTNAQNFAVLIWYFISIFSSIIHKEKITLISGLILGLGFGIGFMQSALWTLGYGINPNLFDWWKVWELNSGFNLGLLYAILFFVINRFKSNNKNYNSELKLNERQKTIFIAGSIFVLIFFVGFEYFFWINTTLDFIILILFILLNQKEKNESVLLQKRNNLIFTVSIFYLLFILFHGVTERLGIVLGIFDDKLVDQYSWPMERVNLFIPFILIIVIYFYRKVKNIFSEKIDSNKLPKLISVNQNLTLLFILIALIGIISIWPTKISIFYGLFLLLAIFSLIQFAKIDELKYDKNLE